MKTTRWIVLASLLLPAVLAGCMLGPNYRRPQTAAETADSFVNAGDAADCNEILLSGAWWKRFGDPVTDRLVQDALAHNYDLRAAAARTIQAEALMEQARGPLFPQLNYGLSRNRAQSSFNAPPPIGRRTFLSTTYGQEVSIQYLVDLFGKLRRSQRAAWRDLLASRASHLAVQHAVVANVVRLRAQLATQQRLLAIAEANTKSWTDSLEIVERRYRNGLTSPLDVHLARENLANSQATQVELRQSIQTTRLALDVLTGRRPGTSPDYPISLEALPDLTPIPLGLPLGLLDQRPDVVAAEMRLAAATERVGVSIAQLFPDLTISGSYGFRDELFRTIWNDQATVYSLTMQLTQPLFQGGQLLAQVKAARARVEEEAANYAGTVLVALQEVEDALVREEMLQEQLGALEIRLREARAAEKLARQRYQQGVENVITVLETERRRRLAENELALTKGAVWTARIDLFLALGGDWQEPAHPSDTTVESSDAIPDDTQT